MRDILLNHPHSLKQLKGCLCYEPRISFSQNPIHQIPSLKHISNTLTLLGSNNIPICNLGVSLVDLSAHIQVFLLLGFNAQRATPVHSAHSYAQRLCNFSLARTSQCAARTSYAQRTPVTLSMGLQTRFFALQYLNTLLL